MNLLEKILPDKYESRRWASIGITILIAGLLTIWGIYGIEQYGIGLFIFTPFFIGVCPVYLFGYKKTIAFGDAWQTAILTLATFFVILFFFAIEGIICLVMAFPVALLLTFIGSLVGYRLRSSSGNAPTTIAILIALIPLTAFIEKNNQPGLMSVTTSIEINTAPETVWKNVIEFPQLTEPTEFIFKTGIAYPVNAKIDGQGVGAIRHCNFTTGSFIEPITVWDEPRLLKFDVARQPAPMKELSLWDIDAPHLHDFFVSKQGQFKLTRLPNNKTLLEGTTWYYHNISPPFYWSLWSDLIVHKIHNRVLVHIKSNSEKEK